jgi:hypothetical protein
MPSSRICWSSVQLEPSAQRAIAAALIWIMPFWHPSEWPPYRSGPSKTWLKSKNALSEAVRREEDWR